jgi:hypothetical protein
MLVAAGAVLRAVQGQGRLCVQGAVAMAAIAVALQIKYSVSEGVAFGCILLWHGGARGCR